MNCTSRNENTQKVEPAFYTVFPPKPHPTGILVYHLATKIDKVDDKFDAVHCVPFIIRTLPNSLGCTRPLNVDSVSAAFPPAVDHNNKLLLSYHTIVNEPAWSSLAILLNL
ncbi:hypothetical protein PPL_08359 [Heterostelium album PN500]|uniref:Uncharacterized protein n=1 Tax=Heterostelium pallidum (strain ATCC 26659 / Pp 5 / PN500) TaxID=670386 RepID=D3BHZ1_HETP5|nr:hypothetical protein PPL_08359 [Heterostelium album PN500]EFA78891.1 hypothetical protein PPL_08359 [Heterostelium album PN500]|eukprot:XP_020431015.1 hypothetical protein PPL_08359 [Heterostelium album PN500]